MPPSGEPMRAIWPNLAIFSWIRHFLEKEKFFSLSIDNGDSWEIVFCSEQMFWCSWERVNNPDFNVTEFSNIRFLIPATLSKLNLSFSFLNLSLYEI